MDKWLRLISILGHKTGIYGWWHRWRRKSEDMSGYHSLPAEVTYPEVVDIIHDPDSEVWRRDNLGWALTDRISDPRRWYTRYQYVLNDQPIPEWLEHSVDCDEASTAAIGLLRVAAQTDPTIDPAHLYLLQVVWRDRKGELHGHHLCAFKKLNNYGKWIWHHLSNWGEYPGPVAHDNKLRLGMEGLVEDIAQVRAGGKVIHAHACMDPDSLKDWRLVV